MTPAELIADLDAALADTGEDCILRRKEGSPLVEKDVTLRASVRGVRSNEIVGTVTQAYSKAVISMSQILAAGWPAGHTIMAGIIAGPHLTVTWDGGKPKFLPAERILLASLTGLAICFVWIWINGRAWS